MKTVSSYATGFLICTALLSCERKDEPLKRSVAVQGYVKTYINGDSVSNCTIELYEAAGSQTLRVEDYNRLATTQSDPSGFFKISFTETEGNTYGLRAVKANYDTSRYITKFSAYGGDKAEVNLKIAPLSWLRFHIKDEPQAQYDSLNYDNRFVMKAGGDTTVYRVYPHSVDEIILWHYFLNGVKETDFIWGSSCPPFDTCNINIIY